jgi:quercetin dioxygenase-like cupin family protein
MKEMDGFAVGPGEREIIRNPVGGDLTFLVRTERSNGTFLAVETIAPPGEGPPLHTHTREEETIYVVSGDFRFQVGDEVRDAPVGSFAFVPRGVAHTWQNIGDEPGKLLVLHAGGDGGLLRAPLRDAGIRSRGVPRSGSGTGHGRRGAAPGGVPPLLIPAAAAPTSWPVGARSATRSAVVRSSKARDGGSKRRRGRASSLIAGHKS